MGKLFQKVNKDERVRYETDDGEDYIEVRADMTKGEANELYAFAPVGDRDFAGSTQFAEKFIELMLVGWSMTDENGIEVEPTIEEYRNLSVAAGKWIDTKMGDHMRKILGTEAQELEGEAIG